MQLKRILPSLMVQDYRIEVHLGCTEDERKQPQEVSFSIEFQFHEPPPGEVSDQLSHTLCYAEVCDLIKKNTGERHFSLVEKLANDNWMALKKRFPKISIQMSVHKIHPPIERLQGGVVYKLGDQIE